MGYHRAGFEVTGVDLKSQPNYPFQFHQANALEFLETHGAEYDVIHASPPCQAYVDYNRNRESKWPRLIEPIRELLVKIGKDYVIENVDLAPLHNPIVLCGTMFGLRVIRHRRFECPSIFSLTLTCNHWGTTCDGEFAAVYAFGGKGHRHGKGVRDPKSKPGPDWGEAMGIDWMTKKELTEAIPPAYTEWIGERIVASRISYMNGQVVPASNLRTEVADTAPLFTK